MDATKKGYHGEKITQKKPQPETKTGSKPKAVNEKVKGADRPGNFRFKH